MAELFAAFLAKQLDLQIPEPFLINVSQDFVASLRDPAERERFDKCIGLNFGCRHITGHNIIPVGMPLSGGMREKAAAILAFDALIQNPDRKCERPNLLWQGESLFVIDHEAAFAFLFSIFSGTPPFEQKAFEDILRGHVFYRELKATALPLEHFQKRLKALNEKKIRDIVTFIPTQWHNEHIDKVVQHLLLIRKNADKFIEGIRRTML